MFKTKLRGVGGLEVGWGGRIWRWGGQGWIPQEARAFSGAPPASRIIITGWAMRPPRLHQG